MLLLSLKLMLVKLYQSLGSMLLPTFYHQQTTANVHSYDNGFQHSRDCLVDFSKFPADNE